MKKKDMDILNSIYTNSSMGSEAIKTILPKVKNSKMKNELQFQLNHYNEISEKMRDEILKTTGELQPLGQIDKVMAEMGIKISTLTDNSTSHIAEMMIQGTNMGIISMVKAINHADKNEEKYKSQAKEILDREQQYLDNIKTYL